MADDDEIKEYRWETGYEKTWEEIREDKEGLIDINDIIQKAKRKRQEAKKGSSRLGMMRHLYIIVDCSEAMSIPDLKPTRFLNTIKMLQLFIEEFFDQNPISQVGIILLKNKRAEKITELAGYYKNHVKMLQGIAKMSLNGEPSLQNGLEVALSTLKMIPAHASREILMILGSLTTCDPGDITDTIQNLKAENVRCSVISLSAETRIMRYLTTQTQGIYSAILDESHFKDQLFQHIEPLQATNTQECSLIKMGFPHGLVQDSSKKDVSMLSMCMCHLESTEPRKLSTAGYFCPQCQAKYCELPVECVCCGLTLVLAPHLARSYHHLFPIANFIELPNEQQTTHCFACQRQFHDADKSVFQCPKCKTFYCIDCDIFIHDTLHTCIGCSTAPSAERNHNNH